MLFSGIFFVAMLWFPLDPLILEIISRFNVRMHHFTLNAMVQLSKFFCAVKTFGGAVSVDAFCRLYELHPQGRRVSFEDDDQVYTA